MAAIEVSELALTLWNVGFQVSSLVAADVRLPPSVVEAVLFGNAGRTGTATDVALADVRVEGYATTTVGLSFGLPIPVLEPPLGPFDRRRHRQVHGPATRWRWAGAPAPSRPLPCRRTWTAT